MIPYITTTPRATGIQVRGDWVKTLGMDLPTTIEEFEVYLEAVKTQDPDGNGTDDTYGISNSVWGNKIYNHLVTSYLPYGNSWWLDDEGSLQSPIAHPNYKLLLEKQIEWSNKGYTPPGMYKAQDDQISEFITSNQIGGLATWYSAPIGATMTLLEKVPEAEYVPVNLVGVDGAANALPNQGSSPHGNVLTKSSKNPEAVLRFWDWLYTTEGQIISRWGLEGKSYELIDGSPERLVNENEEYRYFAAYWPYIEVVDLAFGPFPGTGKDSQLYRSLINATTELPGFDAADKLVVYDGSKFKSESKLADLQTFLDEKRLQILTGDLSLDNWDDIVQQWREMGGDLETEDRNIQYQEWLNNN